MKRILIVCMVILILGCGQEEVTTEEPKEKPPQGCEIMQNTVTEEFNCFGCVGYTCNEPDSNWEEYDQDLGRKLGYACTRMPDGCTIVRI